MTALKKKLASNQIQHFVEMVKIDPESFIESLICFIKNYDCCRRNCKSCIGPAECQELMLKPWKKFNIVNGYVKKTSGLNKVNIFNTGLEFADVFIEIYEGDYKLHVYNICCRQHSKLTYTK